MLLPIVIGFNTLPSMPPVQMELAQRHEIYAGVGVTCESSTVDPFTQSPIKVNHFSYIIPTSPVGFFTREDWLRIQSANSHCVQIGINLGIQTSFQRFICNSFFKYLPETDTWNRGTSCRTFSIRANQFNPDKPLIPSLNRFTGGLTSPLPLLTKLPPIS